LLQGLGFAESLSEEPMDTEDPSDAGKVPAEQTEAACADISGADMQQEPSVAEPNVEAPAPVIPVTLIEVVPRHVGGTIVPLLCGKPSQFSLAAGSGYNVISNTPSAVNLVDKDGKILPTLPSVPSLVGTVVPSAVIGDVRTVASHAAVAYVDGNGRVLARLPAAPPAVHMIDTNTGLVTGRQMQPSATVVDNNGRVISGISTTTKAVNESDARKFGTSSSMSEVSESNQNLKLENSTEEQQGSNSE